MLQVIPWDLLITFINLIVLVVIMRLVLIKPIRNIIARRQEMIDSSLNNAKVSEENAKALENHWNERIAGVKRESADMIAQAKSNAQDEYDKVIEKANSDAADIMDKARKSMELEKENTMREMQTQIADIAMDMTRKVLENSDLTDIDNSLYEKYLTGAGDDK